MPALAATRASRSAQDAVRRRLSASDTTISRTTWARLEFCSTPSCVLLATAITILPSPPRLPSRPASCHPSSQHTQARWEPPASYPSLHDGRRRPLVPVDPPRSVRERYVGSGGVCADAVAHHDGGQDCRIRVVHDVILSLVPRLPPPVVCSAVPQTNPAAQATVRVEQRPAH